MKSNKRGSIAVYAVIIMGSLIFLITAFISIAKGMLAVNGAYALGDLWGASILGEYDSELYRRYGIFAFYGDEGIVGDKLKYMSDYSFRDKDYVSLAITKVDLYDYTLMKKENIMPQIKAVCITDFADGLISENSTEYIYTGEEGKSDTSIWGIQETLPSYGKTGSISLESIKEGFEKIKNLGNVVETGTDSFFLNKYINHKFRNYYYKNTEEASYLTGEQEYIISGRESDEANRKAARNKIIALREVMNLIHIEQDPEKSEAALLAGEAVSLGYAGPEAAHLIMAAWAFAESVNDYELLKRGKPVPLMKDDSSWAIDLESVLENEEEGCVDTGNRTGDYYTDYLMYLLYITGTNTKLLRMMDIIELNMRHSYSSDFRFAEHYTGLRYSMNVNGKNYEFKEAY